jgi:hypothetical protein
MSDCLKFEGALDDEETCFNSLYGEFGPQPDG